MRYNIMIATRENIRKRAVLTTEHSASSYGQPVVVLAEVAYGPGDMRRMGMGCITKDAGALDALTAAGFPISDTTGTTVTISLPIALNKRLKAYAISHGVSQSEVVADALARYMEG